jgi:hypothetical protein
MTTKELIADARAWLAALSTQGRLSSGACWAARLADALEKDAPVAAAARAYVAAVGQVGLTREVVMWQALHDTVRGER